MRTFGMIVLGILSGSMLMVASFTLDTVDTVRGKLKMVYDQDQTELILNHLVLGKTNGMATVEEKFDMKEGTVLLLSKGYNHALGAPGRYFFVRVPRQGRAKMLTSFNSSDGTFRVRESTRDSIRIYLGYEKQKAKYMIYQSGTQQIKYLDDPVPKISERHCRFLYEGIYTDMLRAKSSCKSVSKKLQESIRVSDAQEHRYKALSENPAYREEGFTKYLTKACETGISVQYDLFRKEICKQTMTQADPKIAKTMHSCAWIDLMERTGQLAIRNTSSGDAGGEITLQILDDESSTTRKLSVTLEWEDSSMELGDYYYGPNSSLLLSRIRVLDFSDEGRACYMTIESFFDSEGEITYQNRAKNICNQKEVFFYIKPTILNPKAAFNKKYRFQ